MTKIEEITSVLIEEITHFEQLVKKFEECTKILQSSEIAINVKGVEQIIIKQNTILSNYIASNLVKSLQNINNSKQLIYILLIGNATAILLIIFLLLYIVKNF